MNTLHTALIVAFVTNGRFALCSSTTMPHLAMAIRNCGLTVDEVNLVERPPRLEDTSGNVLLLRNVQKIDMPLQRKLYDWVNELEKRDFFTVVLVVEIRGGEIYPYLKEQFWFAVNCDSEFSEKESVRGNDKAGYFAGVEADKSSSISKEKDPFFSSTKVNESRNHTNGSIALDLTSMFTLEHISTLRAAKARVFVHPDIKKYILSLIVQSRNHRLTLLSPKRARLPTFAYDYTLNVSMALVVLKRNILLRLFLTPEFVKMAFRNVAHWLIDWEHGADSEPPELRKVHINMLSGDWYASESSAVEAYIEKSKGVRDDSSPTGYSNVVVEDSLSMVIPPL